MSIRAQETRGRIVRQEDWFRASALVESHEWPPDCIFVDPLEILAPSTCFCKEEEMYQGI